MDSPQFLQQMSSLMSNPAIVDQIIASNPQLQGMGPQIRQVFQSEQFRQMMCASPRWTVFRADADVCCRSAAGRTRRRCGRCFKCQL